MEIWKEVEKYPKLEVSDLGRVRNRLTGKVLIGGIDSKGYRNITVITGQRTERVHIFVAAAFLPEVLGKPFINHKDGIKLNCASSNLERCTAKENTDHAYRLGLIKNKKGIKLNPSSQEYKTKKIKGVNLDDNTTLKFNSFKEATNSGFDRSRISDCIVGKITHHKRYIWSLDQ